MKNLTRKIETAVVVLYSLAVIASITPFFSDISNLAVVVYYLFVPGYAVAGLIGEDYGFIQRSLFSVMFGLALVLGVFSLRQIQTGSLALPYAGTIPILTIVCIAYRYYRTRPAPERGLL